MSHFKNDERQDFYCRTDSFCSGLPNIVLFYSNWTPLLLLFCLFLYICTVIQLEFSHQNGGRATEAPPKRHPKRRRAIQPFWLLPKKHQSFASCFFTLFGRTKIIKQLKTK